MTDVQVSNARRIVFTALAVVAFWVMAWWAYSTGGRMFSEPWWFPGETLGFWELALIENRLTIWALSALCPMVLLWLSRGGSMLHVRNRWVLVSTLLCAFTTVLVYLLAEHDAWASYQRSILGGTWRKMPGSGAAERAGAAHEVSWFWLLLPIILTTAFVIFGAWRRAVRDAEVDAVGESE